MGKPIIGNRLPGIHAHLARIVTAAGAAIVKQDISSYMVAAHKTEKPSAMSEVYSLCLAAPYHSELIMALLQMFRIYHEVIKTEPGLRSLCQDIRVLVREHEASINDPNHLPFNVTVPLDRAMIKSLTPGSHIGVSCSGAPQLSGAKAPSKMHAEIHSGGHVFVRDLSNREIYFIFQL